MGGLAGHMMHPHDNKKLTIKQFKELVHKSIAGEFDYKEKLDGFNIHLIKVEGEIRFARNGSDLVDGGFTSDQMSDRFTNERIRSIFRKAFDLVKNNSALLDAMVEWDESHISYNCEILAGQANVINYSCAERIIIHNCHKWEYNTSKERFEFVQVLAAGLPKDCQLGTMDYTPRYVNVAAIDKEVDELFNKYGLNDSCTLNQYYELRFLGIILQVCPELIYTKEVIRELYERMINKTTHINLRELRKMTTANLSNLLEKEMVNEISYLVRMDLDELVLRIGTLILDNIHGYMNEGNKYSVANEISNLIPENLPTNLEARWNECDRKVFALEGVVFEYNGDLYKWTGPFAPINQIVGGNR